MRHTHLLVAAALALASAAASATCSNGGSNWPTCTPPVTPPAPSTSSNTLSNSNDVRSTSNATAGSSSTSGAAASVTGTLSAAGGSGGSSSLSDFSRQNMYVLPAPVSAAPLPPGLCPQGDSVSWGFGWNFISYSSSSTRSEMECLDKVLAAIKPATPVVQQMLAPLTAEEKATLERLDRESNARAESARSAPANTTRPSAAAASGATKPKKVVSKKPAQKKADPVLPDCGADGVLQCRPKKQI